MGDVLLGIEDLGLDRGRERRVAGAFEDQRADIGMAGHGARSDALYTMPMASGIKKQMAATTLVRGFGRTTLT